MKFLYAICLCFLLTACGTVNVQDYGSYKEVEFTDPPAIGFPPEAAFAGREVQGAMDTHALIQCPNGYTIKKKFYNKEKHALVWHIKCE